MLIRSLVVFVIALCALPVFAGTVKSSSAGPVHALTVDLTSLSLDSTSLHGVQTQCWQGTGFSAGEVTGVLKPVKVISIDALTTSSITISFHSDSQAFSNVVCAVSGGSGGGSTSPGSPVNSLQFNSAGGFGGSSYLSTNETTKTLGLSGNVTVSNVAVPAAPSAALAGAGSGNLPNDVVNYVQTWVTASGESSPSAASNSITIADHTVNGQITATLDTAAPAGVTSKNLYRSVAIYNDPNSPGPPPGGGGDYVWKKVNSSPIAVATATFTDNVAEGSLGARLPGWDTTGGVIADSFGTILRRSAGVPGFYDASTYTNGFTFLSPGYDDQGRFATFGPQSASAFIRGGGSSGGMNLGAQGDTGSGIVFGYFGFGSPVGTPPTQVGMQWEFCQLDISEGCGSPGIGSATPVTLFALESDFGGNQLQISSVGVDGSNASGVNYSLAMNETGTPLGVVEAANLDGTTSNQKSNFVGKRATGQTLDIFKNLDVNGTTRLPFHVLSSGYAAQDLHTPANSSESCTTGQWVDDTGFHYVCTSTNTWKRSALSSF